MKVKLLKKVRKRFTINKVTKYNKTPFYRVEDLEQSWWKYGSDSYDEAYEELKKQIRNEYGYTVKEGHKTKIETVWYNQNK